jgi:hypothetical protein
MMFIQCSDKIDFLYYLLVKIPIYQHMCDHNGKFISFGNIIVITDAGTNDDSIHLAEQYMRLHRDILKYEWQEEEIEKNIEKNIEKIIEKRKLDRYLELMYGENRIKFDSFLQTVVIEDKPRKMPNISKNGPCHCNSGKLYRSCHFDEDKREFYDGSLEKPVPKKNDAKIGRNQICTCGSGKKAKKCCLKNG